MLVSSTVIEINILLIYQILDNFVSHPVYLEGTIILRDVMPCNLVEIYQCFGGMYFLCHQSQRISGASNHQEAGGKQSSAFPPKRW
jgi:hypothetical protein